MTAGSYGDAQGIVYYDYGSLSQARPCGQANQAARAEPVHGSAGAAQTPGSRSRTTKAALTTDAWSENGSISRGPIPGMRSSRASAAATTTSALTPVTLRVMAAF